MRVRITHRGVDGPLVLTVRVLEPCEASWVGLVESPASWIGDAKSGDRRIVFDVADVLAGSAIAPDRRAP